MRRGRRSKAGRSQAETRSESHDRSTPQPAAEVAFPRALQSALGNPAGSLSDAGVELALGDEGSGAVAELALLAAEVLNPSCGGGLTVTERFELFAAAGKPARSAGFHVAAAGSGLRVGVLGLGEPLSEGSIGACMTGIHGERTGGAPLERGGQPSERVGAARIGGSELLARRPAVAREVQAVRVASTAECRIGGFAVDPVAGEHVGVVDGETLRDMGRDGVGVTQRRVAVRRPAVQEAGVENDPLAAALEHQPAAVGVERCHSAAVAVDDPTPQVVDLDDDVIADGEVPAGQPKLMLAEKPSGAQAFASPDVEVVDVGPTLGDHHRPFRVTGLPPVGDEALARTLSRVVDTDPVVGLVERERPGRPSLTEVVERGPFPGVDLASILRQRDRQAAMDEAAERAACLELGSWR